MLNCSQNLFLNVFKGKTPYISSTSQDMFIVCCFKHFGGFLLFLLFYDDDILLMTYFVMCKIDF